MTDLAIELSDIIVRRGRRDILCIDRLSIRKGEFLGILGPNGAGKSTFLKVCGGLVRPRYGQVCFDGAVIDGFSGWQLNGIRRQVGYVPQSAEYYADLPFTVRDVAAMGLAGVKGLCHRLHPKDYRSVDDWLERLGISHQANQTFRSLSGGEQQKVLIARAMAAGPKVVLLDEPGSNLDFVWRGELTRVLERVFLRNNITVLMVSHDSNLLPACCDRAIFLDEGSLYGDGSVEDILALWRAKGAAV